MDLRCICLLGSLIISREPWQENVILWLTLTALLLIEIEISDQSGFEESNNMSVDSFVLCSQASRKKGNGQDRKLG